MCRKGEEKYRRVYLFVQKIARRIKQKPISVVSYRKWGGNGLSEERMRGGDTFLYSSDFWGYVNIQCAPLKGIKSTRLGENLKTKYK